VQQRARCSCGKPEASRISTGAAGVAGDLGDNSVTLEFGASPAGTRTLAEILGGGAPLSRRGSSSAAAVRATTGAGKRRRETERGSMGRCACVSGCGQVGPHVEAVGTIRRDASIRVERTDTN
jgi:hypothetical protein